MASLQAAPVSLSSPSSDSLTSTGSNSKESRFNRLLNKLNSSNGNNSVSRSPSPSAENMQHLNPSTPVRYVPGTALGRASPAFSDIDDLPLRPPVFESKFMRELEMGNGNDAPSSSTSLSPRPPLAASYSSPAAVPQHHPESSSSPTTTSSGSLRNRLVRVASSSSLLFAARTSPQTNINNHVTATSSSPSSISPCSTAGHRKTASLMVASDTPSPRARLAASLVANNNGHKHRHSEDVRHLYAPATGDSSVTVLGYKDPNAAGVVVVSNDKWQKSKDSLLTGLGNLTRKRSIDGLSSIIPTAASTTIQEEEDLKSEDPSSRPSSSISEDTRPALGGRLYSADRVESAHTTSNTTYNLKSTPGFPRVPLHPPSTSSNNTSTGISSGLSESSKRFRSAFRLNKSRNGSNATSSAGNAGSAVEAPGTGGLGMRRAMRVPLSQQAPQMLGEDEEPEQDKTKEEDGGGGSGNEKSPEEAHSSLRSTSISLSSISSISPPAQASSSSSRRSQDDRETAHERAQLIPSLPTVSETERITHGRAAASATSAGNGHTAAGAMSLSLRARRAPSAQQHSPEAASQASSSTNTSRDYKDSPVSDSHNDGQDRMNNEENHHHSRANSSSYMKHSRSTSRTRLEDLMLVPEEQPLQNSMPRSTSDGSVDSDTLIARKNNGREGREQRQGRRRSREEEEVEMLLDDAETEPEERHHVQAPEMHELHQRSGGMPVYRDENKENANGRYSPPMLGAGAAGKSKREEQNHQLAQQLPGLGSRKERTVLGEVRQPQPQQQPMPVQLQSQAQAQRGTKLSSSSSNGGLGYHPSDRQVVVNDYAVPLKRGGGDTPPEHNNQYYHYAPPAIPHQQQDQHYQPPPSLQPTRPPPSLPPTSSLPSLPKPSSSEAQPPTKRTAGTITVKGKVYARMGLLGRGGSSKVFRVSDKDHQVFALKRVDLGKGADNETYQSFLNEIELLERLRGVDRIIQLVASEVNEARRSLVMVMEIGEIDMNALLQERSGKRVSMNFIRHTWEQMLEAVNVIHEEGIVHTDLKPANFVLVKGALKLIDFGIAKAIPNDTTNIARDQQIGTANYMSPEALNPHISNGPRGERVMKLGRPSDVWSLGCILYQIVYGHTPFGRIKNLAAKMNAIQTPGYQIDFPSHAVPITIKGQPLPDLAVRVEEDLLKCMKDCLRYEPKRRATIPELLEHPFLRRGESTNGEEGGNGGGVEPEMMNAIVGKTLQWAQGRQPSRSEQERFVEAMLRQLQQMQAGHR